jgi:hypothetical protein
MKKTNVPAGMMKRNSIYVLLPVFILAVILASGCGAVKADSEGGENAGKTIDSSSDRIDYDVDGLEMSVRAKKILKLLMDLSNDDKPGVIVG